MANYELDSFTRGSNTFSYSGGGDVQSVNGQTGEVVLDAEDVGALADTTTLADLSDDSTHRLVTDTEKTTWNGKSDFSGSYNDLTDKPTIPDAQIQSDWNQTDTTAKDFIKNKPSIPSGQVNADWEASSGVAEILHKPTLGTAAAKDSTAAVTSGSTDLVESGAVKSAIDAAVASAYHPAGPKTVAELLPALLIAANEGNVYNMTDAGITTSDFIEGAGNPIRIGDNVGIANVGSNTYKFDLLSGFIDTSDFVNKSSTTGLIKNDGTIDSTSYAPQSTTYTKTETDNAIAAAAYSLPIASDSTLGGIKVGSGLSIDPSTGELSATGSSNVSVLDDLTDVTITSPADGDILIYDDDNNIWVNGSVPSGTTDYEDLSNKPSINGITLDGNVSLSSLGLKETITLTQAEYDLLPQEEKEDPDIIYFISDADPTFGLGNLQDVDITSPADGDILVYDDTNDEWVNEALTKSTIGLSNVDNTSDANKPISNATAAAIAGSKSLNDDVVTVTDAADMYADELSIDLDPIQDLHGYDKPWVGGAGKNYVDYSNKHSSDVGNTTEYNSYTGELKVIWASGSSHQLVLSIPNGENLAGKTITLSYGSVTSSGTRTDDWRMFLLTYVNGGSETIVVQRSSVAASSVTINIASNVTELRLLFRLSQSSAAQSGDYVIWNKVQIEEGSTATTYEPYENICSIQGYDIVNIDRCGKNLIPDGTNTSNGYVNNQYISSDNVAYAQNDYYISEYFKVKGGDTYTFSNNNGTLSNPAICFYDVNKNFISGEAAGGVASKNVTVPSNAVYARSSQGKVSNKLFQFEHGSTATTYEPYNGQTVSLQLGNKNLLPMTVEVIKGTDQDSTWSGNSLTTNGVTFTIVTNSNGIVTKIHAKRVSTSSNIAFLNLCFGQILSGNYFVNGGNTNSNFYIRIGEGTNPANSGSEKAKNLTGDTAFTADSSKYYAFSLAVTGLFTGEIDIYPMLRDANIVDPTFSPYNPTLGGMVYGGQLTLKDDGSAVFVGDKAEVVYDGSSDEAWELYGSGSASLWAMIIPVSNIEGPASPLTDTSKIKASYLETVTSDSTWGNYDSFISKHSGWGKIVTGIKTIRTVADWKTYLASNPLQVVYTLATPFTIHLSAEQLKLLQGTNNVWSNAGDVTLKYQPDNVIAEPKADVQRLRDDVDDRLVGNACKNLLSINTSGTISGGFVNDSRTSGGVTYTRNSDNTVSVSGTRDSNSFVTLNSATHLDYDEYIISGGGDNFNVAIYFSLNGSNIVSYKAYKSEVNFIPPVEYDYYYTQVRCETNGNVSGVACPMIRRAKIKNGSYEEYYPSNRELWEMIKALQNT